MKYEVSFRITVTNPLVGVIMKVQKGKSELLEPETANNKILIFDFKLSADLSGSEPNFLGPFAHGPKNARFIYVNSGTYAGQNGVCWSRRAKLSLMSISKKQVESVIATPGARLETIIPGVGRDGGPICASVKNLEWTVASR